MFHYHEIKFNTLKIHTKRSIATTLQTPFAEIVLVTNEQINPYLYYQ